MAKYYKAFNRDMTCRDMQYKEGETYEIEGSPILCKKGFHFCKALVLTLDYYPINEDITENKYAEIEILGDVVWEEPNKHKGVTNKIKILRVIDDEEVKVFIDKNRNSGDRNIGNRNSGNWNSGDRNIGNWNSGDSNSGDSNSGNWNSGDWNSGDSNSGNWNSGNWNSANRSTGFFNTKNPKYIKVFNKKCLLSIWEESDIPDFLYFIIDPELGYKVSFQKSWDEADEKDRIKVKDLPNFNAKVFYEISGIKVK